MFVSCNFCKNKYILFELENCTKCNNRVCNGCLINKKCKNCIKNFSYEEKKNFCNKYNLKICIHCNEICEEDCKEALKQKEYIKELLEYLTKININDDIYHF
tara:strand:- start:84 stop:389 length:306 start_codon:yes stop_codon:yes gene_type:complete